MERGLAALASIFTIAAIWLISSALRSRGYEPGQIEPGARLLLGLGSGVVAAILFSAAAIVDAIKGSRPPNAA